MKKWMYLIFPGAMLGLFLAFYLSHKGAAEIKEREHVALVAKKKADDDAKKKAAEGKAREDAKKRADERDAEEKKKEDEKAAKQAADDKQVRDKTAEYVGKADTFTKEVAKHEIDLDRIRKDRDKTSRESFELAKQVELTRVARRNAELEIQRKTEMVIKRAAESSLTRPPVMPVVASPAK